MVNLPILGFVRGRGVCQAPRIHWNRLSVCVSGWPAAMWRT